MNPVELHVVSDSTGETAARLVQALEAQFPEQEFVEIRHPRVESVADLQLAVERMRGRPAVVVYTLVETAAPRLDAHDVPARAGCTTATCSPSRSRRSRRCRARSRGWSRAHGRR